MKRAFTIKHLSFFALAVFYGAMLYAQPQGEYIAAVGLGGDDKKIVLFDPEDGSLAFDDFLILTPWDVGTVKHAMKVQEEIWISDQTKDKVYRFDLQGNYLGAIGESGGLDNIRGMNIINGEVWLSNAGSNNGAPGKSVIRISFEGTITGNFLVEGSPWSFLPYNGDHALISFSNSGGFSSQIAEYDLDGNYLAPWSIPGELNFIQQITETDNGEYLASSFSNATSGYPSGIHRYDSEGNYIETIGGTSGGSARGNFELGNGNIMWTNNQGVNIANTGSGTSTVVYNGSFQFLQPITFGPPPVLPPPTELTAELNGTDVTLEWTAPEVKELLGYNVYRDDVSINTSPITETTYVDEDVPPGSHIYGVTAVYDNGESVKAGPVEIFIDGELAKFQGFVRDAGTNISISNAWIVAGNTDNGTISYSTPFGDHYVLRLPAGTYDLTCGADGYGEQTISNVTIQNGGVKTYTFYLQQDDGDVLTGMEESQNFGIEMCPNPASGTVTISGEKIQRLQIFNQSGEMMLETLPTGSKTVVGLNEYAAGVYFVKITHPDKPVVEKLIVK